MSYFDKFLDFGKSSYDHKESLKKRHKDVNEILEKSNQDITVMQEESVIEEDIYNEKDGIWESSTKSKKIPKRFGKEISKLSCDKKVKSYHHADSRFVVVSAASIIAKVSRDKAIARLRKTNDLGSGYPSDRKTIEFVKKYYQTHKIMPNFVRKSWKPTQKIMEKTTL